MEDIEEKEVKEESVNQEDTDVKQENRDIEEKEVKEPEQLKIHVEVWGKQAVNCVNILDKGCNPTITGTLDEVSFLGKDGKQIRLTVIRYAQVLDYGKAPTEKSVSTSEPNAKVTTVPNQQIDENY